MNLLELFRKKTTAPVARDRLQVLLAHERSVIDGQLDIDRPGRAITYERHQRVGGVGRVRLTPT